MFSSFAFTWIWEWSSNLATTSVTQLLASNDSADFNFFSHCHRCICPFLSEKYLPNEEFWEGQVWVIRNEG